MAEILKSRAKITSYGYDGEGVCRVDGKVCFVPFALKDEEVEFSIVKSNSSFSRGELTKIIKKSEKRTEPPCPYFGKCGGCTYQHTTHENELEIKKELLASQLKKLGFNEDFEVFPSSKEYGYRNKIKLFVYGSKIGLKQRQSDHVCDIENCMIASAPINKAIQAIRVFFNAQKLYNFYEEIVIKSGNDFCLINFIMKSQKKVNYQGLYLMLGSKFGIYETFKGQTKYIVGIKNIQSNDFGLNCEFSIGSFHQVNDEIEKLLYQNIVASIKGENILNCYSGGGVLSGIIAAKKLFVTGIELGQSAHEDAEKLKDQNNLIYLRNLQGDCATVLPKVIENSESIIVDPPRSGMNKNVVEMINLSSAKRFIYVSCNSATFVRDASLLKNYTLKEVKLFDMFPRTGEYEILGIFDKKI